MNFKSVTEISGRAPGRGGQRLLDGVTISTDRRSPRGHAASEYTMRFSISQQLTKKARFMPGDRVDVLIDREARLVLIKRVSSGGWALSYRTKSNERAMVQISWCEGLPSVKRSTACSDVQVTEDGIIFKLPDSAVFDRNARLDLLEVVRDASRATGERAKRA